MKKKAIQLLLLTVALAGFALADEGRGPRVPEIDASSAVSAVGLLTGAMLIFQTRRKK